MQQTIIGESSALMSLLDEVSRLAPINRPLLILGERGTGKELIAERLHFLSTRWEQLFIKVNCAAFSEQLLESELFGHESGAFTGANRQHQGHFERANHGTLFLDEIGTLSDKAQEKLLRVIEYGEFQRLGGHKTLQTDVRILAATNEDLLKRANSGEFRADLLDRLAFDALHTPPLRERGEDIALLIEHFALKMTQELQQQVFPGFTKKALKAFYRYQWPGNIRELKNAVERSLARCTDWSKPINDIKLDVFSRTDSSHQANTTENNTNQTDTENISHKTAINFEAEIEKFSRNLIANALQQHQFKQTATADALGLRYDQLRYLIRKYELNKA